MSLEFRDHLRWTHKPPRRCRPDLDALNRRQRVRLVRDIVLSILWLGLAAWLVWHG